ncbi:MAG TPA: hypothetical protein VGG39_34310 [Polyangiaceae bacterium]|jgi:hypothetical protein
MTHLARHFGAVSVVGAAIAVTLALAACGQAFTQGSSGGSDAGGSDGASPVDSSLHDGGASDASAEAATDAAFDAAADAAPDAKAFGGDGAAGDGSSAGDAGVLCHGAFATPTLVLAHTSQYLVDSFTLTPDELEAFVTLLPSDATSEERKVYEMHRAHPADVFVLDTTEPVDLTNDGPTPGAFDVGLSADGLTLYFAHRQDSDAGLLGIDIYEALRGNAGDTFSGGSEFGPAINDPTTTQFHPHPGGSNLYFTVTPIVSGALGQRDLYVAPLAGGARAPIAELNGATTQEANPVPSIDQLELFFASDRANPGGNNLVYDATRTSPGLVFGTIATVPLSLSNPSANVTPQFLTADRCKLYVLVGQEDVYVSQRAP